MTGVSEEAPKVIAKASTVAKPKVIVKEKKAERQQALTVEILRGAQKTEKSFTTE